MLNHRLVSGFLLTVLLSNSSGAIAQTLKGRVISSDDARGIAFVNVGIPGKNIGTVTDEKGNYSISLDKISDNDSVKFSMIGYKPEAYQVAKIRNDGVKDVYLNPQTYNLPEIEIKYHNLKKVVLGNPVKTDALRSGFAYNELGSEMGIEVYSRKPVLVKNINLDVSECTYDSVTYMLNVYLIEDDVVCDNILTEPVYITFRKEDIDDVVTYDLSKYSITFDGEALITLEFIKDPGEGKLFFRTEYFTGTTYHRKTSQGTWSKSPGAIGMYLNCLVKEQ